jgi:hypothetical protein
MTDPMNHSAEATEAEHFLPDFYHEFFQESI